MPSLNLDLNYFDNTKTLRLASRLGKGSDVLPIRLWTYVGRHHPESGVLEMLGNEIETICGWWGKRGAMIAAMIETGFLKREGEMFVVHDWLEHSGHLATFKKRAIKAARKRWGVKSKSSNASSNARSKSKQCPSSAVQCSAVQSSSDTLTPSSGEAAPEPTAYRKPDPKTNPLGTLVYAYKLAKEIPPEDPTWDKAQWPRASREAKELLDIFASDLRAAVDCLEAVSSRMKAKSLDWTLRTVVNHAHDWKIRQEGHAHGPTSGERSFDDFAKPGRKEKAPRVGGLVAIGKVLSGFRDVPDVSDRPISSDGPPRTDDVVAPDGMAENKLEEESD